MLQAMSELVFPDGFLWGTASSAHQTEGGNSNSDWWDWELKPDTPTREPSGKAIEQYTRYARDAAMVGQLGFNMYRFGIEWARIEPEEGRFDEAALEHYRKVIAAIRRAGMAPLPTLYHFTLPRWVAAQGGWLSDRTPALFGRYVRRVVEAIGDRTDWYMTINEPGVVAFGGYLGAIPFPPGRRGVENWRRSIARLIEAHRLALAAIKELRPAAKVGMAHSMQEWESNWGGRAVIEYSRRLNEDVFLAACKEDDYIGVNSYTRQRIDLSAPIGVLTRIVLSVGALERRVVPRVVDRMAAAMEPEVLLRDGVRRTQMGWEWRPQAVAFTVRRVAELHPGKPILVTEHGVATANDEERVEFIRDGLTALHPLIAEGIPLRGYLHWTAFDNFEWAYGYSMLFGLIGVDRKTQERTIRPSARFLGGIARTNRLVLEDSPAGRAEGA
jgi:beta-glucosidase